MCRLLTQAQVCGTSRSSWEKHMALSCVLGNNGKAGERTPREQSSWSLTLGPLCPVQGAGIQSLGVNIHDNTLWLQETTAMRDFSSLCLALGRED